MATARPEDQVFFVYDHTVLQKEEDDLRDAIAYFFPSSISLNDQCALCGQLMGMVEFFSEFNKAPPSVYVLQKNKVAVKHLGRFTLALSGNRKEATLVLQRQLESLYQVFLFYQGGFSPLLDRTFVNKENFIENLQVIWDSYLPFLRRYGDAIAASFESLPTVELSKNGGLLFLRASHLLQFAAKLPGVHSGCIMFKNRILCSLLPASLTSRLLIVRPQQAYFPCEMAKTDYGLPAGVRIVTVYVNPEDHWQLTQSSSAVSKKSEENPHETADTPHTHSFSVKRSQTFSAMAKKAESGASDGGRRESLDSCQCKTSQCACENPILYIKKSSKEVEELMNESASTSGSDSMTSDSKSSSSDSPVLTDTTSSIFRQIKKVAAQSTASVERKKGSDSESSDVSANPVAIAAPDLIPHEEGDAESHDDCLPDIMNEVLEAEEIASVLLDRSLAQCKVAETECSQKPLIPPPLPKARFSPRKSRPRTASAAEATESELVKMELYIQGSSDTILVLFMDHGCAQRKDTITCLWQRILPHLADLEIGLHHRVEPVQADEEKKMEYNYLTFNLMTKALSGRIAIAGNTLLPMRAKELDFCDAAVHIHEEFQESPSLHDITLRNHSSAIYAHTNHSQEMYFQSREKAKNQTFGIPSARDNSMDLESKAFHSLWQDKKIHII